ncbi:MAG: hypothetical protein WCH39_21520, partial [Schlesneria sp.]
MSCRIISIVLVMASSLTNNLFGDGPFSITPSEVAMKGKFDQAQLLVTATAGERGPASAEDFTRTASFTSSNDQVAVVSASGRVFPRGDGTAEIAIKVGDVVQTVKVAVTGVVPEPVIDYLEQVRPVLYKAGCNMGACHAAQHGQGGFKLSVFGFDPAADRTAMARDVLGRRINQINPTESLLLRKPTMQVPHSGGRRLEVGSPDYELLSSWIRAGAPGPAAERPISKLVVTPNHRLGEPGLTQQLRVDVVYADGASRDVTAWAKFDSMDEGLVSVSRDGYCT